MGRARVQRIWMIGALTMASLIAVTVGFGAYVTAAVFNKTKNLEPTGGEVSLRSYFQKGSGTDEDPFVISRPIHFYNLSRLQNLGVFSNKTHFVLGYDPSHPEDIFGRNQGTNLTFYKDNSSNDLVSDHTLDMSDIYSLTDSIASIGDEQTPFYGEFDGQGLAISGLKISSKPEDVGVFGYTAPGSNVHDLYLINPKVTDDGYETNVDIAPLFTNPDNVAYAGSVTWNAGLSNHTSGTEPSTLTSLFDNEPVDFGDTNDPRVNITATLPNLAAESISNVDCEYRISSPILTPVYNQAGTIITSLKFNKSILTTDNSFSDFVESADGGTFHVRMSLVASSITSAGLHYSKTISSYLIVLIHHKANDTDTYSYQVIKDTFDGETSGFSQYKHGANIGLLCGHAEGSFTNCFVYGGTISVNNQRAGIIPLAQESETGLFGEIGASVDSSISPQKNYEGDKDTGVLNFSKMYEDIAGGPHTEANSGGTVFYKYNPGEHIETFVTTGGGNVFNLSYQPLVEEGAIKSVKIDDVPTENYTIDGSTLTIGGSALSAGKSISVYYASDSADKFKEFLRNNHLPNNLYYATKDKNTVDFTGRRIIEDTESDKRKGMGVFSLVTTASQSDTYGTHLINELGGFVIKRDNSANASRTYNDFYYTTAEWNADPDGDGEFEYEDVSNWNDISGSEYHINQPYSFPTSITPTTWNPYFERYFNYNIHCNLSANSTTNNYFFNTGSEFLKSYFSYKLVNSAGVAPDYKTAPFGVFVRNINPDTGAESAITKFDSVLEISEEPTKHFKSLETDYTETFDGNGVDRIFELKHLPLVIKSLKVGGVEEDNYSRRGNVLTLTNAPAADTKISITYSYENPTKSVVFSIKNSGGANVTLFAASNSDTDSYVGIYRTSRDDLYDGEDVTSKPDYAMYCPYYPANETVNRGSFHYYTYDYAEGTTPMNAVNATPAQANRLYAHTFRLKQGEYIVSSPEGNAQLVYLCAQGQNGKGNTGLSQPNGAEAIRDVDFIAESVDPVTLNLDQSGNLLDGSTNIRCYFSFNSIWDNSTTETANANDLVVTTGLSGGKPTIDLTAGNNLTYLLADNEGRYSCSLNGDLFERQFYEYVRSST